MILISHRGNINGIVGSVENHPSYIQNALDKGYDVEIDIWKNNDGFWLGHDEPKFKVDITWLYHRRDNLWIHCKNIVALEHMSTTALHGFNYFWHQEDKYTLTSKQYVWAYPNMPASHENNKTITVLPEWNNTDITSYAGVCSDFIEMYKTND